LRAITLVDELYGKLLVIKRMERQHGRARAPHHRQSRHEDLPACLERCRAA
jgi:hypothetical protein